MFHLVLDFMNLYELSQLFRQPVVILDNNQVIVALWNWNKSICQIILLSIVAQTIALSDSHYSANWVLLLLLLNNLVIRLDFFEQNPHLKMFFNKIVSSAFEIPLLWVLYETSASWPSTAPCLSFGNSLLMTSFERNGKWNAICANSKRKFATLVIQGSISSLQRRI